MIQIKLFLKQWNCRNACRECKTIARKLARKRKTAYICAEKRWSMEENKYKYLVDVCNLADDMSISCESGCSPDDLFRYTITVRHTTKAVRNTFCNMVIRKEDDILYCLNHYVNRVLELVNLGSFDPIHNTFDLDFIGTEYSLDSEFAKGLKRINSLDDIEKSHVDEPGERGEQGTTSGIPLFSDVVDVLNVKHECGSMMTYVTAARTDKTFAFLTKWDGTPPPREFLFSLRKDDTNVFKLINVCIDFSGVTFEFSYYGNVMPNDSVSFFVPTLTGPRGSQPLWQSGKPVSLCVPEPETPQAKEIVTLNMHMDVGEIHPDYSMYGVSAKSTLEREMDLIQRCKLNSYLFGRKEDPKFPQMRRARLNKPKSI